MKKIAVRRQPPRIVLGVVIFALIIVSEIVFAQQSARSVIPAAKIGNEIITLEEVQHALHGQLAQIERQRHGLMNQKLEELIEKRLLDEAAAKRRVTVEQLLKDEVEAKTPKVLDSEVSDFIEQNRARLPQGEETELRLKVSDYLRSQKLNQQRLAYVQGLRDKANVTVYLEEPASARVRISAEKGIARGPKDAPVTIVEFSDYQCPFCKTVLATMNEVLSRYGTKVNWVFRDFPSQRLHPTALTAHEAARCAGEQGKYWEYHDLLFERSPNHSVEELEQYARELKLGSAAFSACLASGKYKEEIAGDLQEGLRMGVSGTPTFFINGRLAEGAMPFAAFEKIIEGELARNRTP